jgi:hypothetical protein
MTRYLLLKTGLESAKARPDNHINMKPTKSLAISIAAVAFSLLLASPSSRADAPREVSPYESLAVQQRDAVTKSLQNAQIDNAIQAAQIAALQTEVANLKKELAETKAKIPAGTTAPVSSGADATTPPKGPVK